MAQAFARSTDPWTSWEAARSVTNQGKLKTEVLFVLRNYGAMTHEGIVKRVTFAFPHKKYTESGIRTRVSELVKEGLVADTGTTERSSSGRWAKIWRAV